MSSKLLKVWLRGLVEDKGWEGWSKFIVVFQTRTSCIILISLCWQDQPGCSGSAVLREIQCRVCSQLHQMFIAVPDIAKLVHFQVLDVVVACTTHNLWSIFKCLTEPREFHLRIEIHFRFMLVLLWKNFSSVTVTRGQFNNTFTSVIYKCSCCFQTPKQWLHGKLHLLKFC